MFLPNGSGRFIFAMIWRKTMSHESVNNIRLFLGTLWHVFLYLLNQRMAIYHREGQLRIFYLARSVPGLNSAFLWKTAVILIDEIQRCPKQSAGSPTAAHRRGAPVLSLFPRKKGTSPENTRSKTKIPIFSSKGPKKQHFFTGSGKVDETLLHLQTTTILAWLFSPAMTWLIETGPNNELIILLWGLMLFVFSPVSQLNGWSNTSPRIHPIYAHTASLCVVQRRQGK